MSAASSPPEPQVSVLVVAYNSRRCITRAIAAIAPAARETAVEVLLVDNGQDGTGDLVAEQFPQVRIVPSQGNIGFARGNNLLAMHARAPLLLLLNPDMYCEPGAIDALAAAARRYPDAVAWGGISLDAAGRPDTGNAIIVPSLRQYASAALGRTLARRDRLQLTQDERAKVLLGGFVMIARPAWDAAGGFDERFFLYCEEVDLFARMGKAGGKLWSIPAARAQHELAHGENLAPRRLLYMAAGTAEYLRKHWSAPKRTLGLGLLWLASCERYLAGKLLAKWRPRLAALGDGHRLVATRPGLWLYGYDPVRGLKAKLDRGEAP
ncbi:MAG: glycosyltransferase family 2 protein [Erythrobacter sp.]|nr:MAG: glycosyltransferase family 2 protein [Erythrobacter sp.]